MKRILTQLVTLSTAFGLSLGVAHALTNESTPPQSCADLHHTLHRAFPNVLLHQPNLDELNHLLGNYTKKEKIADRYKWEQDDFLLIIQTSQQTTNVSIIPEKMEKPGEPPPVPDAFEAILSTTPSGALNKAKKILGIDSMKQVRIYEYSWPCVTKAINPNTQKQLSSAIRAQFDDTGDFIALSY